MRLKDYKRCPVCNCINNTGKICSKCVERIKTEENQSKKEQEILENFKYNKGSIDYPINILEESCF